jgi:UPF0042 nucleotide-binding protein
VSRPEARPVFRKRRYAQQQVLLAMAHPSPILIITGRSGSGKSTAMAAMEDAGFYCVDNMPVALLPQFLALPFDSEIAGVALVMDLREKEFLTAYPAVLAELRKKRYRFEILFLEAEEETLLRRYSQTRRQHPLAGKGGLVEAIRAEEAMLRQLREEADRVIDTSRYSVHELRAAILEMAQRYVPAVPMRINLVSFGFKFGSPREADLLLDVRFLPNPYFIAELKPRDGEDSKIRDFVLNPEKSRLFLTKLFDLLEYLIPLYKKEGKAYLTIAIGCTGGRHRSVAVACALFEHITEADLGAGFQAEIHHRDIHQE